MSDANAAPDLDPAVLRAANIHPVTHLATDYLNHFNEVVMLMELLPDMPDMFEDVRQWQPKSYQRHFLDSGFAAKDLAVAAYDAAPPDVRRRFDGLVADMDTLVLDAIARLAESPLEMWPRLIDETIQALHALIEATSAVVNGTDDGTPLDLDAEPYAQAAVDALFATS